MKKRTINALYWVSTIFVLFVCFGSGVFNILQTKEIKAIYLSDKLPLYLSPFLGVIKILGAITIMLPFLKRFHEAAYAGLIFYFTGATYAGIAGGGPVATYGTTSFILIMIIISYLTSLMRNKTIL